MTLDSPSVEREVRGRRAWFHALGVLDGAPDPGLDAIVAMADRLAPGGTAIWLIDGSSRRLAAGVELPDASDASVQRRPIELEGLIVGEVVMAAGGRPEGEGGDGALTDTAQIDTSRSDPAQIDTARIDPAQIDPARIDPAPTDGALIDHVVAATVEALQSLWERRRRHGDEPVGVLGIGEDFCVGWASPEVAAVAGIDDADALLGRSVLEMLPPADLEAAVSAIGRGMTSQGTSATVPVNIDFGGGSGPAAYLVSGDSRLHDPEIGFYGFAIRRAERPSHEYSVLADQMWVLNRLGAGAGLQDVLAGVIDMVEHHDPSAVACVMVADESGEQVEMVIGPNLPPALADAVRTIPIGPDSIGAGATVHRDVTRTTPDVHRDASFTPLRPLLAELGIKSCWSHPIRSVARDVTMGALDVYRTEAGSQSDEDTRVLVAAARLVALCLDHDDHERSLLHQATHDPLTCLPNRVLFDEQLVEAAQRGPVGVLFIDLDRFKLVNDTLGHAFGDEVLQEVAARLLAAVDAPALVARFGGDEFTVLVPEPESPAELVAFADRLLGVIAQPYEIRGTRIDLRASAGAALGNQTDDLRPQALVRDADSALYHAKDRGRGRVELFDDYLLAAGAERVRVEAVLREALEHGRIGVHFQPAVRLSDGAVVGMEALARCATPSGAALSPATFIEVAEEVGLISDVFEVVLRQACEMAARWNATATERIVVWVNLSPQQLGSAVVVEQVRRVLAEGPVDAALLGFEVTERGILPDPVEAADCLGKLAALGARLAIDDFGTGYSSLGYLQGLPVDTVKLDRSFIVRAGDDPRSRAIVGSVVDLTRAMGLECVAEGVETLEQLEVVRELGCPTVQGYVFARPMPVDEVTAWLADRP
jgi:diguanylate cyclase (GGDEF)-like protein